MARNKPKGWVKRNVTFLQPPATSCMAAVSWRVCVEYWQQWDKSGDKKTVEYQCNVAAELNINDEAKAHYVGRKADLRPLRKMRKELDAFEDACVQALVEAEEYHAKSKEST